MVQPWLQSQVPLGAWLLDPFGSSPWVALEAAQAGYRVLVTANNPVGRFLLEMLACAPKPEDFRSAMADLASARKGDERLERHIQELYATECAQCGGIVQAQAYLWERGANQPYARLYTCPQCGESGEQAVTPADLKRLSNLPPAGLHRARALERIAPVDDPARPDVEEALNTYLPRSLYVLFTLINKLDTLGTQPARRALLTTLLLSTCDAANSLWPHPTARSRPRQLSVPPRFRENNLWISLDQASNEWSGHVANPIPIQVWPEQAPAGGITLYPGRFKEFAESIREIDVKAVVSAFPRPNQAYWTLSALWAGWLWGREAVTPLKTVLSRRRYDWAWHTTALQNALGNLAANLPAEVPFFGLIPEAEPSFLAAALIAAAQSHLTFQGIAYRSEQSLAQVHWKTTSGSGEKAGLAGEALTRSAIQDLLTDLGEPTSYTHLYGTALSRLAHAGALNIPASVTHADALANVQHDIRRTLADRGFLIRYGGSDQSPENAHWWLRDPENPETPQADRVEVEVVHFLQKQPGIQFADLDLAICQHFTGMHTPSQSLVQVCLESYGHPVEKGWRLRDEDTPSARRQEINQFKQNLVEIGNRFGYQTEGSLPVVWREKDGSPAAVFYTIASSWISRFVFSGDYPDAVSWVVLPGGRSNLLAYKLRHDPRLQHSVSQGWRFIKFRRLRELANATTLTGEEWLGQAGADRPEYTAVRLEF